MTRLVVIVGLCAAIACGDDGKTAAPATHIEVAAEGRVTVAEVNEHPVFADCVVEQARAHGLDRRAALDECIDFELLAQEAEARGLAAHPEAVAAQRREAVRRLLVSDFEANHDGPEDVPMEVVQEAWRNPVLNSAYNHPEYRWCVYVRAPLDRNADPASPAAIAAEAAARRVHRALTGRTLTMTEFFDIVEAHRGEDVLELAREPYNTPRKGRSGENFARALFAIPRVGQVSEPTRTRWGWDVILLTKIQSERYSPIEEVADEVRKRIFVPWRERAFLQWAMQLSAGRRVAVEEDWASKLPQDPLELP